jgi:hypothetical protein
MHQQLSPLARQTSNPVDPTVADVLTMLRDLDAKVEDLRSLLAQRRKENYTIEEFAQFAGRSPYTARRWVSEGKIEAIRVQGTGPRGRLLIPRRELDRLIRLGKGEKIPEAVLG